MEAPYQHLLTPSKLYSRAEVLGRPSPAPNRSGVYAWYIRNLPGIVPTTDCHHHDGLPLVYVGIAPSKPSAEGKVSQSTLRKRLRQHLRGNAYGSTLRRTLGCLLSTELGITMQKVGSSGRRFTYAEGEAALSGWIGKNAFVTWLEDPEPWDIEDALIAGLSLPLNLRGNESHPFHATLKEMRLLARHQGRRS